VTGYGRIHAIDWSDLDSGSDLRDAGAGGRVAVAQAGVVVSQDQHRKQQRPGSGSSAMHRRHNRPDDAVERRRDVQRSENSITIDFTCVLDGKPATAHSVITGSFDSVYPMMVTSATPRYSRRQDDHDDGRQMARSLRGGPEARRFYHEQWHEDQRISPGVAQPSR
jgi:hypothetical protein